MTYTLSASPAPPRWASRSVSEDGGVTHERISSIRPALIGRWPSPGDARSRPTEVSVSAVDQPVDGGWSRTEPTVQVEGGCYSVEAARQLRQAIDDVLAVLDQT